jgi:uncharacterized protein YjeT (DUF2065 family)
MRLSLFRSGFVYERDEDSMRGVRCKIVLVLLHTQPMKLLTLLIGLILILEGLPYVAAPDAMQNWLKKLADMNSQHLRLVGIISMAIGLGICFVVQKTSVFE